MRKKGQIWISAVLYILIAAVAMVLILQAGMPLLNNMRDRAAFTRSKDVMLSLDQHIGDVADEGQGSQRVIPIEVRQGNLIIGEEKVSWELDTNTQIIEPRSKVELGNLNVYSNIDVDVEVADDRYVIQNSRIKVEMLKFDDETSDDFSDLIDRIYYDEEGMAWSEAGTGFDLDVQSMTSGSVVSELIPDGNNTKIDSATVVYHVMASQGEESYAFDINFVLESQADFVKTKVTNLKKLN